MRSNKKSQFSAEFVVLMAFMFVIFVGFIAVATSRILEVRENERQQIAEDIATLAKNEIDLARFSSDGYYRTFELPNRVQGNTYTIGIQDNRELVITFVDKEHVVFLEENIIGDIGRGLNEIRKVNGVVYIAAIGP